MHRSKLCLVFLTFLLVALPLKGGISHAQDDDINNFIAQYFVTNSASNSISYIQGISGIIVPNFTDSGQVFVGFNNVTVNGIYNVNYGVGSYRNQGSLAFVNIQPEQVLAPAVYLGQSFSENNKVNVNDYNYSINLNFNGFRGSGIVVLNLMAGSFSNQFTSVHFSMGKNVTPPPSPTLFPPPQKVDPNLPLAVNNCLVSLSNEQMKTIAASYNPEFKIQGKQNAIATVQGVPNVQGVCAITLSSGVNNLVSHHVGVYVDTGSGP